MEFKDIIGQEFDFYGVDGNHFKLGDNIWEAVEDEDDGYRSMLGCVRKSDPTGLIFFAAPYARVKVVEVNDGYFDGYHLVDSSDGHIWLQAGTENAGDYYPWFCMLYDPKAPTDDQS